jgi:hypothetical protein
MGNRLIQGRHNSSEIPPAKLTRLGALGCRDAKRDRERIAAAASGMRLASQQSPSIKGDENPADRLQPKLPRHR